MSANEEGGRKAEGSPVSNAMHDDGYPLNGGRMNVFGRIRRVPRYLWLVLSAAVLFTGTLAWVRIVGSLDAALSQDPADTSRSNWWTEVPIRGADATLPEISGRLFGVAVQKVGGGRSERVWIVGSGGLLAYTQTEGRCWTFYEYDKTKAQFHPQAPDPCRSYQLAESPTSVGRTWPAAIPTVFAASVGQSSGSASQKQSNASRMNPSTVQQKSPPDSSQQQTSAGQQKTNANSTQGGSQTNAPTYQQSAPPQSDAAAKGTQTAEMVKVFPTSLDFGDVSVTAKSTGPADMRVITISNQTSRAVRVGVSGFTGDSGGEFHLDQSCSSRLGSDESCEVKIYLIPTTPGKKNVSIEIQNDFSKPVIVQVLANVHGTKGESPPVPNTKKEPSPANAVGSQDAAGRISVPAVPDLLAIGFDNFDGSRLVMVSTGGLKWTMERDDAGGEIWTLEQVPDGVTLQVGGLRWQFVGSTKESAATETY